MISSHNEVITPEEKHFLRARVTMLRLMLHLLLESIDSLFQLLIESQPASTHRCSIFVLCHCHRSNTFAVIGILSRLCSSQFVGTWFAGNRKADSVLNDSDE